MDSRRARAVGDRDRLIREIVANAKVFQGGGSEVLLTSLEERIKAATDASLVRMFPRFKEADSAAWEAVIKRAREGADHPFQPTGHTDATEKHARLPAGDRDDRRRQVGIGRPQDAGRNALRLAARRCRCGADCASPAPAHHRHPERPGDPAWPARSEQDRQGGVPGRARDACRSATGWSCGSYSRRWASPARAARKPSAPASSFPG